jgi:DNA-binding transcriptional LysR family regulator
MNLRQLEVFHAIMQTGSVTAAARDLHVTQPAISNVLKHTEMQLGFKLFERIGGRLQPTPEAEDLMPDVNEIFGRIGTFRRFVQDMRDGRAGRVVLATSPTLVNAFLPRAVALFRQRNPAVHITIQSLPTPLAVERVARREVDLGLVYAPVTDAAVTGEELVITEMACAVLKNHPLARKRSLGPRDLERELLISLGAGTRIGKLIEEECRKAGVPAPEIGIEASSSLAACLMVSEGAGIGLVDRATSLSRKFDDLAFRPFVPRIAVAVQLIYPRDRPRSRATLDLSAQLRRTVRTSPH